MLGSSSLGKLFSSPYYDAASLVTFSLYLSVSHCATRGYSEATCVPVTSSMYARFPGHLGFNPLAVLVVGVS
jgi:hypothetical protein